MSKPHGKLISELKVHELRVELTNRGLDGNGVKAALVARLEKVRKSNIFVSVIKIEYFSEFTRSRS